MNDAVSTIPTDQPEPWVCGEFKFRNQSQQALLTVAHEWLQSEESGRWSDLWLRETQRGHFSLCFMYNLGSFDKEMYDKFVYKMTDKLKREFGNDLVGWDISSKMWVIK